MFYFRSTFTIYRFSLLMCFLFFSSALFGQKFKGLAYPTDYTPFSKDTLTILSWNVEHFVDEFDNPYIRNGREDTPDTNLVRTKIDRLAEVIQLAGADVVVLQEFESRILAMRIAKEKLASLGFRFFAGNESPDWYMNVVVMSKVPIGMVYGYGAMYAPVEGFKDSLGREETQNNINTRICSAEIKVNEQFSFILTGVHLKAGRNDKDVATRLGQIRLIQGQHRRFLREDNSTKLVLLGDLNAIPDTKELNRLLSGKKREKMIDPLQGKSIFSHPADKPQRRLDHILVNEAMYKNMIPNSVKPFVPFSNEIMKKMSDHLPMIAQFVVKRRT